MTDTPLLPASAALETGAPAPLAPLHHVVISPANIAAEQRAKSAVRLTGRQRRAIRAEIKQIDRQLSRMQYRELQAVRNALRPEMERLQEQFWQLKTALQKQPDNPALIQQLETLWEQITPAKTRWDGTSRQWETVKPLLRRKRALARRLEDHKISIRRDKTEARIRQQLRQEADIYEQLIVDRWTRLGYCYRYTHKNKERLDQVQFAEVVTTLDAHYFKIDASYQTAFRNWKTNLPNGVRIVEQLLNPGTLDELSLVCQRQVTGIHSPDGAWVVVHRLNSVDGLMNYVKYEDVMNRYPGQHHDRMPICAGVAANRQVQWINLSDFPHWLIGGYTASGKSNMVNVGICTLISRQSPDDLRLILIDLKGGLEFNFYEGLPHVHRMVDSVGQVAETLAELEALMESRFRRFKAVRAKRIEEFHARRKGEYMPRILCVFDEVASITDHGDTTKRISASLRQLAAKGRAVGIHLWLCTQRPDVKVIEGAIKANLAVRISGRMTTTGDSVTILGNAAARDLAAVPGRMVLQLGPDGVPVQTPHISDDDIAAALKRAAAWPQPPPLDVPDNIKVVHQEWTPERVVELALTHLGGNVTAQRVYEAADDLSRRQAQQLVERVWSMGEIEYQGCLYRVERGRGHLRRLVPVSSENAD